jgi:hypothetical protein
MALEATHVRFARDIAEMLGVKNASDYYSGVVYPDSRFMTRVSREATHPMIHLTKETSDFEKGWLTHVLYDQILRAKYMEGSPWAGAHVVGLSEAWIYMTAVKWIEDQRSFDVLEKDASFLQELTCPEIKPNQEDPVSFERYYQLLRELYHRKPLREEYVSVLEEFHVPSDVVERIAIMVDELMKDPKKVKEIEGMYEWALEEGKMQIRAMQNKTE